MTYYVFSAGFLAGLFAAGCITNWVLWRYDLRFVSREAYRAYREEAARREAAEAGVLRHIEDRRTWHP